MFNLQNASDLSRNRVVTNGDKVRKKKENITVKRFTFTLLFAGDNKEMYQNVKRTRRAIIFALQVQVFVAVGVLVA